MKTNEVSMVFLRERAHELAEELENETFESTEVFEANGVIHVSVFEGPFTFDLYSFDGFRWSIGYSYNGQYVLPDEKPMAKEKIIPFLEQTMVNMEHARVWY